MWPAVRERRFHKGHHAEHVFRFSDIEGVTVGGEEFPFVLEHAGIPQIAFGAGIIRCTRPQPFGLSVTI